jgi:YidC/Oxa1 family membrane protein insertase
MEESKQTNHSRFLMAAVLSLAVLFGWQYFFAPKPPVDNANNSNTAVNANTAQQVPTPAPVQQAPTPAVAAVPDNVPNRQITIKSPLYEVTLDSRGALATSWVLLKNVSSKGEKMLYGDGSTAANQKPLQLISEDAKTRAPRELPFRLSTQDANIDTSINDRNYSISETSDTVELKAGQEKKIDFTLNDGSGVEITKTFLFRADSYISDLGVKLNKNGQPVPNTRLVMGASIGDQSIAKHNFYHIESEAVGRIGGKVQRYPGGSFTYTNNQAAVVFNGPVDWAGTGDTYFAQAAITSQSQQGLEYRSIKYEVPSDPYYDGIIAWVTRKQSFSQVRHLVSVYVPVNTDGTPTRVYTGSKDFFTLREYDAAISQDMGHEIDFANIINYGWVSFLARPLSVPILYSLHFIYTLVHNYGVAIIIFTLLFYSLLFPLRWSQSKSFKKAAANQPKMKEIQDKLKDLQKKGVPMDDPRMRSLQMEQLKMTKNALPLGGCLPMLLQFPLLIALYVAVTISLDFRQATFLWLPDLSAGDPFHILEFSFAISMGLSMKFTPTAPSVTPEQQMQQKMMTYFMPVMMLWVMWAAPSGLLLYWFSGNIVSFVQQMIINRMNKNNQPPVAEIVDSVPKNAKKIKPKLSTS